MVQLDPGAGPVQGAFGAERIDRQRQRASALVGAGGVVVGHPDLRLSYDFYLRRPVREIPSRDLLAGRLADSAPAVVITTRERWSALASGAAAAPTVAAWGVVASATVGERDMVVVGKGAR